MLSWLKLFRFDPWGTVRSVYLLKFIWPSKSNSCSFIQIVEIFLSFSSTWIHSLRERSLYSCLAIGQLNCKCSRVISDFFYAFMFLKLEEQGDEPRGGIHLCSMACCYLWEAFLLRQPQRSLNPEGRAATPHRQYDIEATIEKEHRTHKRTKYRPGAVRYILCKISDMKYSTFHPA